MNVPEQYDAACHNAVRFDLSSHSKIELAGPEARVFLHNLCTNDVKNLPEGGGCEGYMTTAKARVVGQIWVTCFVRNEQPILLLDSVPGQAESLLRHLNHYLISEQVEIADRTAELAMHRFAGPVARGLLEGALGTSLTDLKHLGSLPVSVPGGGPAFVRRFDSLSVPAFDVFAPATEAAWLAGLEAPLADPQVHEVLRIEGGLPLMGRDIDENRLVMEIGRAAQAISYTKGCFLGQEPIVMARDRGQVNRMLGGVKAGQGPALAPGSRLFQGETEIGQVTSSAFSPRLGEVLALAYLKRGHQEPGTRCTIEPAGAGRQGVIAALPFV